MVCWLSPSCGSSRGFLRWGIHSKMLNSLTDCFKNCELLWLVRSCATSIIVEEMLLYYAIHHSSCWRYAHLLFIGTRRYYALWNKKKLCWTTVLYYQTRQTQIKHSYLRWQITADPWACMVENLPSWT
jgi:hypothetical protein